MLGIGYNWTKIKYRQNWILDQNCEFSKIRRPIVSILF